MEKHRYQKSGFKLFSSPAWFHSCCAAGGQMPVADTIAGKQMTWLIISDTEMIIKWLSKKRTAIEMCFYTTTYAPIP
jgi:hypothetical protein